jgi:carbamoyltransferase
VWNDAELSQLWLAESESGLSWEDSPSMQHWKDLAWQVQDDAEQVLLARARWLRETTGAKNLCMAGGVALNCVANGRIVREAGFDNVWIQPAAGDDGIAIGCAYYGHLAIQKKARSFVMTHAYLGASYGDTEVQEVTDRRLIRMETRRTLSPDICGTRPKFSPKVTSWDGFRGGPSSGRARWETAASWRTRAIPR